MTFLKAVYSICQKNLLNVYAIIYLLYVIIIYTNLYVIVAHLLICHQLTEKWPSTERQIIYLRVATYHWSISVLHKCTLINIPVLFVWLLEVLPQRTEASVQDFLDLLWSAWEAQSPGQLPHMWEAAKHGAKIS